VHSDPGTSSNVLDQLLAIGFSGSARASTFDLTKRRQLGEALPQVDDLHGTRFLGRQSLLTLVDLMSEDFGKAVTLAPSVCAAGVGACRCRWPARS
jgi:hypothetical protein